MRNVSTVGFLTNGRRTIAFTIPLDKPVVADEIYFSTMHLQVRHINGGMLINEDVMQSNYSVLTEVQSFGIFVTITNTEQFDGIDEIPVSVYISEASGMFYTKPEEEVENEM